MNKFLVTLSIFNIFLFKVPAQKTFTSISLQDKNSSEYKIVHISDSVKFKRSHLFSIYSGYSYHVSKDDVVSSYIYSGSNAPIDFTYKYFGQNTSQTFSLFFNHINLKSDIPDLSNGLTHRTDNIYISLHYSYNKHIYTLPKYNIKCFLGGEFKSFLDSRVHYFSESTSEFNLEQITSLGLNLILQKLFKSNNDILFFQLNTPVISYSIYNNIFSQKSYINQLIDINNPDPDIWYIIKNGKFITMNKFFEMETELCYTKFIFKRIGLDLKYGFDYYSYAQYKTLIHSKYLISQLQIGITVKI